MRAAVVVCLLSATAAAAEPVTLWHGYRAGEEAALVEAVRVWTAAHPDVPVELVAVPYDAFAAKIDAAVPRGNGPDLFIAPHETLGQRSQAGLIVPLTAPVDDGAFLLGTVDALRANGRLWGLPLVAKTVAMYCRRDLAPEPPGDLAALEKLRAPGVYPLAYESGNMFYHAAFLHAFGGRLLDDTGRPALDSPAAVSSLALVADLQRRGVLPEEASSLVATQLFNDRRAACVFNGPWLLGEIAPGVDFSVAPLPRLSPGGEPLRPLMTVEAVFFAARGRHPDGARAFAEWLAGTDGARIRAKVGRQPVAAVGATDIVDADPVLGAFRAQLTSAVVMPTRREMTAIWEPSQRALRRVLRGATSPSIAARDAERETLALLRPPPPPASPRLWLIAFGAGLVLLAAWAVRRASQVERGQVSAWLWLLPAIIPLLLLAGAPFAVGAAMSLFHRHDGHYSFVGAANFLDILTGRDAEIGAHTFYFTLGVTILWTVANVTLHVVIGVALALLLRDPLLRLRGVYRALLILPWAMPSYITALIWKGLFHRQLGAINALLHAVGVEPVSWFSRFSTAFCANLATNVWLGFPFMMVVALGALARIPRDLEDAAALDGASRWQRLRHVVFPLLLPSIAPSIVLGAVWTFNMFNVVFLVSGGEPDGATEILVSQAYRWAFDRNQYGYAAAYAVLIFAVLALQSRIFRRRSAA